GGGHDTIPEGQRLLAGGGRRDDWAEERGAGDRDHRGADILPDPVDAVEVAGPHLLVILVGFRILRVVGVEAKFGERSGNDLVGLLRSARVDAGAEGVVEGLDDLRTLQL